ncbi:MAG: hypothetical protein ACHQ0Y_15185 [Thermodesulfovibrionales bacterium]
METRSKVLIGICSLFVVVIALFFSGLVGNVKKSGLYFKWSKGNPQDTVVQVTTGKEAIVPFEFRVEGRVSKVSLAIGNESLKGKGISFEETVVPVRNGVASSKVIFNILPEGRVGAGRHYLTIIASDVGTGRIIREGEIPFALDMLDLIWRCSC